jgi:hypothetical protein
MKPEGPDPLEPLGWLLWGVGAPLLFYSNLAAHFDGFAIAGIAAGWGFLMGWTSRRWQHVRRGTPS